MRVSWTRPFFARTVVALLTSGALLTGSAETSMVPVISTSTEVRVLPAQGDKPNGGGNEGGNGDGASAPKGEEQGSGGNSGSTDNSQPEQDKSGGGPRQEQGEQQSAERTNPEQRQKDETPAQPQSGQRQPEQTPAPGANPQTPAQTPAPAAPAPTRQEGPASQPVKEDAPPPGAPKKPEELPNGGKTVDPRTGQLVDEYRQSLPKDEQGNPLDFSTTKVNEEEQAGLVRAEGGDLENVKESIRDLGGDNPEVTQTPIVLRDENGKFGTMTLFKVKGADGQDHFVDGNGSKYSSMQDYLENNEFSDKWTMLRAKDPGATGPQELISGPAHMKTTGDKLLEMADDTARAAQIVGGAGMLYGGATALTGVGVVPGGAAAAVGGVMELTGTGWLMLRGGSELIDRFQRGRSISISDPKAAEAYGKLVEGGAGLVLAGAGKIAGNAARDLAAARNPELLPPGTPRGHAPPGRQAEEPATPAPSNRKPDETPGGTYRPQDVDRVAAHLSDPSRFKGDPHPPNVEMIRRIRENITGGKPLSAGQQNFMRHELRESELMDKGMDYDSAHIEALKEHPPGKNYDPDVIDNDESFGPWWRERNGLPPR